MRQNAQVIWTEGNPQERSHGDNTPGHLFLEIDKQSVSLFMFIL